MARFSLSSYTIRVKDEAKKSYEQIDNLNGGTDLLNILNDYLSNRKVNLAHDRKHKKLLGVEKLISMDRLLNGIIETGDYGYESNLKNIDRGSISYKRKIDEAEMLPFYYLIHLPKNNDEGIVILQRFKQFGIRKHLLDDFTEYFTSKYPNLNIEINPLVPETLIQQSFYNGRIIKIRFIKFEIPKEIEDAYDNPNHKEIEGQTELSVSVKRNDNLPILNPILEYLKGNRALNKIVELQDFNYEDIKVELMVNKTHRTISLTNLNKVRAYYDITDKVKEDKGGHPSFESIDKIARELLKDLNEALRKENPDV